MLPNRIFNQQVTACHSSGNHKCTSFDTVLHDIVLSSMKFFNTEAGCLPETAASH